jgi:putative redox protein
MVQIDLTYEGNLRVRAVHKPSGTILITDAPVDNLGKGESFSPTDLVATALGSCMATTMGIVADRHSIDLTGMKITVKKHMIKDPLRRIGRLEVNFWIPNIKDEKDRKLLQNTALTCPVHKSLHSDVNIDVTFNWENA